MLKKSVFISVLSFQGLTSRFGPGLKTLLIRRKRNKILYLKNSLGEWINDLPAVMQFVKNSFLNLFTTEFTSSPLAATSNDFVCPWLSDNEFQLINLPVRELSMLYGLWRPLNPPDLMAYTLGFIKDSS